ncbi:uncharacterized protein LOC134543022 [Bacillus rossius redtenbacheri]|uniref:uncharacterized protein LOC134543022 n=1 Tax=Bacillus rossius redtenbacheri TaxID=93214 RepID=UPI002FDE8EB8
MVDAPERRAAAAAACCSCLCLPLARRRPQPPQQPPPSPTAAMVQMFYYENRGKCCKKLLRYNGYPNKVLLFPDEGWARSASSSYWTLTPAWWSRNRCKVVEIAGTRRYSAHAKMVDTGTGNLYIVGSFKRMSLDPDFKLYLTSNVTTSDFNMGYSMTGTLERGSKKSNSFQMTHFAVIRRRDYDKQ